MSKKFSPKYSITSKAIQDLVRIENAKTKIINSPLTTTVLASLRESARIYTTHYSTMIEGNRLSSEEIEEVLKHKGHFPGRERDEHEIKGYYAALTYVEQLAAQHETIITEKIIKTIHALVMNAGKSNIKPTPYRDGQNMICDSKTRRIVYLPPQAHDVTDLMGAMVNWINENTELPAPLVAGIAHYQFATIHPYFDGNGRTARLLTTLILHSRAYDLKGIYSLEEYYARDLNSYYEAINASASHNYYEGREVIDITQWVEYFIHGMAYSCEKIANQMAKEKIKKSTDHSNLIKTLDPKQRKALKLFHKFTIVTALQIGELFKFKSSTSAKLCSDWVENGFLEIVNPSNRGRTYKLADRYAILITE